MSGAGGPIPSGAARVRERGYATFSDEKSQTSNKPHQGVFFTHFFTHSLRSIVLRSRLKFLSGFSQILRLSQPIYGSNPRPPLGYADVDFQLFFLNRSLCLYSYRHIIHFMTHCLEDVYIFKCFFVKYLRLSKSIRASQTSCSWPRLHSIHSIEDIARAVEMLFH